MKLLKYRCIDNVGVEGLLTIGTVYIGYGIVDFFGDLVAVKVTDDAGQKNTAFQGKRFVKVEK